MAGPKTLSKITNRPCEVVYDLRIPGEDVEQIELVYNAAATTSGWVTEVGNLAAGSDDYAKLLASVLIEWDIVNDDGSAYPPTEENILVFPAYDVVEMCYVIFKDLEERIGEQGKASAAGSQPAASLESPPNGTSSSQPVASTPAPLTS
jgi:hypothetical protein